MPFALTGFFRPLGSPEFTPLEANPYFWFEARNGMLNSSDGVATEGEDLAKVTDLSGNGRHLTQTSSANRPKAYPNGDGTGYAHFRTLDAGEKHMDCDFGTSFDSIKFFSVFSVIGTAAGGGRLFSIGSGASDTNGESSLPLYCNGPDLVQYHSAGTLTHTGAAAAGRKFLKASIEDGSQSSALHPAAALTGTAALASLDFQRMSIASGHHNSSNGIDLNIELVIGVPITITPEVEAKLVDYILDNFINSDPQAVSGPLYLGSPLVSGNFVGGTSSRNEISGGAVARLAANEGKFFLNDDSSSTIYCTDQYGADEGSFSLTGASITDAEAIAVTNESTPRVIIGAFGDNAASRTTKQLFIFDEPVITGSAETVDGADWEQVDFQYPASPLWAGGNNRGDAEAMFVADSKIYIISKREAIPKLFSLPLQSSYSGTQTLTYEGEIYDIPDVTGVTVGNVVDATISSDELHVVVKTYGQVWAWSRVDTSTDIPTLLATAPTEMPYVGLGNHPDSEPQGETIMFNHDDSAIHYLSEQGTGSVADNFPLFKSFVAGAQNTQEITYQQGVGGYSGCADTYIWSASNSAINYGSDATFIVDNNASDDRFALLRFSDIEATFPAGATLFGAALNLHIITEGISMEVYQLTNAAKSWAEGTVTWDSIGGIVIGTDTPAEPCGVVLATDTRVGAIQVTIDPSVIQGWLDNPSSNYGFVFAPTDLDGIAFASKDGGTTSQNPELLLQYTPDPDIVVPVEVTFQHGVDSYSSGEDTYWWKDGSGSGDDNSAATTVVSDKNTSDERFGYHKWGALDSTIPSGATITEVEIDLNIDTEGQGIDFFELLSAFDQTDSYDDLVTGGQSLDRDDVDVSSTVAGNWPGVDNYTGPITIASNATLIALVQKWVDTPASNHGLLAVATHPSDGQQVSSNESASTSIRPLLRVTYTT